MKSNKLVVSALMSLSVFMAQVQPAHAFIGVGTLIPPLIAVGGAIAFAGGYVSVGMSVADGDCEDFACGSVDESDNPSGARIQKISMWVTALGFVLLDDNGSVSPQFTAISNTPTASSLRITQEAALTYDHELDQVNSIYQTVLNETQAQMKANPKMSRLEIGQFVDRRWFEYSPALSAETVSTLVKIRTAVATSLNPAK